MTTDGRRRALVTTTRSGSDRDFEAKLFRAYANAILNDTIP